MTRADTIYALSSGRLPAAIAVVRISGPDADAALRELAGALPEPRRASLRTLRDSAREPLDRAIVLRFPGPASATGEDLVELHLHGGIAVVAAVSRALVALGLREAEPGEFTRRALFAGRLDPAEVEGLADLLAAETETQRRDALRRADGALGRIAADWHVRLNTLHAMIEAAIDHDDEADVDLAAIVTKVAACRAGLGAVLAAPPVERLRDGIRVVLSGPPNAGKSSLFNALLGVDAAIVSPIAGTTRDLVERPVAIGGVAFVLIDTAGVRETLEMVERIGVERARRAAASADIVLDLAEGEAGAGVRIPIAAKADIIEPGPGRIAVSVMTGQGIDRVVAALSQAAASLLPALDEVALDRRHREALTRAFDALTDAKRSDDLLIVAEYVRVAASAAAGLVGHDAIEAMLDTLFSRFCLGK